MSSSRNKVRIVIKIEDEYFLTPEIYESFKDKLVLNQTIFSEWNRSTINELYPAINFDRSESIFENMFSQLAGLSNSFAEEFILESLFSVIDNTDACNLMLEAYKRTNYIEENILNFFFIETSAEKAKDVLSKIRSIDNSGIEYTYIRGEITDFVDRRPGVLSSVNDEVIEAIDDLFSSFGVKDINSNNTKIVDVEQAWDFTNAGIRSLNLSAKPILGGGFNFSDIVSKTNHGTNTLNVLFGEEIRPSSSTLNALCKGDNVRVASVWFSDDDERCEAALASLFGIKFDANGNRIENTETVLRVGDIVLLELQITISGFTDPFPIEIEPCIYDVIKLGIKAGFIIIEAAGNGNHNLNNRIPDFKDLSTNELGTGAIMVGAIEKASGGDEPTRHPTSNYGRRVDSYCFGDVISILTGMTFSSTSLASSVIAALATNLQKKAKISGKALDMKDMKKLLSSVSFRLPGQEAAFIKSFNGNFKTITTKMENKKKLSHQGIRETSFKSAKLMKERFKADFIDGFPDGAQQKGLVTTGYFIGKALLSRVLAENEDAAGIIFSFGLNKSVAKGGQLHLILEAASGIEIGDVPNYIDDREIFATGDPGNDGPDDLIPAIKPTPPPPPR